MNFFKNHILLFVVFITGAAVLIVEVTAIRILSPYFGNTIFTASSVISVILAALSFGYYFGGRLADRHPSPKWFYGIIFLSGLSIFLLQLIVFLFLPTLGYNFSVVSGPLVSATILFFIPSFLLGTLSPFAIKLQQLGMPKAGMGRVIGDVFFWSTFGSIFGSLSAGFILIPHFGVNQIITVTGATLTGLALIALALLRINKKILTKLFIISGVLISLVAWFLLSPSSNKIVYNHDGVYERILIYNDVQQGKLARYLMQDRTGSGGMFLESDEHVFDFSKYYVLYRILNPDPKEIMVIGGGSYTIPKSFLKDAPKANVSVIEIEPSLFSLGKSYFNVPDDQRLKNYIADGRRYLHDSDKKYDVIFSDVYYSLYSVPVHFTTREFFAIAETKLNNGGVFIANLIGSLSEKPPSFILSEINTFQSVFRNSYFFAVDSPKSKKPQNFIFVGYKSDKKINFGDLKLKADSNETLRNLSEKLIDLSGFDLSRYIILTDNYAPVEYMISKVLSDASRQ